MPLVTQCQKPTLEQPFQGQQSTSSTIDDIKGCIKDNKRDCLELNVLLTENKPVEIRSGITSCLAEVHNSDYVMNAYWSCFWYDEY